MISKLKFGHLTNEHISGVPLNRGIENYSRITEQNSQPSRRKDIASYIYTPWSTINSIYQILEIVSKKK
jgi:hypothetical protein